MAKSMIIYGVPGGKTRFAQRIAEHFGLKIASGAHWPWYKEGHIYFRQPTNLHSAVIPYARSFQSVADEINASIPLTDWQSGPPPMVGEWNASPNGDTRKRRWWDGKDWSCWYYKDESQESQDSSATGPGAFSVERIKWRGLSAEPIKVTE